jgi:AbrB family looped-hinge helix DNA binding protein
MNQKNQNIQIKSARQRQDPKAGCCRVESVVTVDDRGQMVLPKEIREKLKLGAGDKLALVTWQKGEEVCCISLIPVDSLTDMVKGMLGPVIKEIF